MNLEYLKRGTLSVELFSRGIAWLDTGTYGSLLEASNYVETIQNRQGLRIACLEEIAYRQGFVTADQLRERGEKMKKNDYGQYLINVAEGKYDI